MQEIIVIAGPNGAGKTSFANEYLPAAQEGLVYLNADEIAREIADVSLTTAQLDLRAGREMLARMALVRSPESMTTAAPFSRSVATVRKRVGRSSKLLIRATGSVSRRSISVSFCPWISPLGSTT